MADDDELNIDGDEASEESGKGSGSGGPYAFLSDDHVWDRDL